MNLPSTILIADDHPFLLKGLKDELSFNGYEDIIEARNGIEAYEKIVAEGPRIAILDIEMPILNAFEVITKSIDNGTKTSFIILTSHKEKGLVYKAQKLNISGYILKDEPFEELETCINAVLDNRTYFSKTFESILTKEISPELEKIKLLSPSERTIVRLIAQEKSTMEISEILTISHRTVQKHRANIIAKLSLSAAMDALPIWVKTHKEIILNV